LPPTSTNVPFGSRARIAMHLLPRAERAVERGHPWVFAHGVRQQRRAGRPGDLAVIFDGDNRFLAIGLYDPDSPIRVRVLHRGEPETIDREWLVARIQAAIALRAPLLAQDTTGFRIVHGENDGLPGLVVDRYDDNLGVKIYTAAWIPYLDDVIEVLRELLNPARVVLRLGRSIQDAATAAEIRDGQVLLGAPPPGPVLFRENALTFEADLIHGQKTGFFLDQRDNRSRVEQYAAGRSVLNVFAYTGGFSVYAARGGAVSVASLDISAPALAAAERNFRHNRAIPAVHAALHQAMRGDAFALLPKIHASGESYDMVVLDPPSFAKTEGEVERALGSYARLVRLGLKVLSPGGLLVAASCSSRITTEIFGEVVHEAARKVGRPLHVLHQTGHPLDHPVGFPEGAYLKCIFATAA
jgi:23S rRNA (cytosine1962-C5)-methyltransferase